MIVQFVLILVCVCVCMCGEAVMCRYVTECWIPRSECALIANAKLVCTQSKCAPDSICSTFLTFAPKVVHILVWVIKRALLHADNVSGCVWVTITSFSILLLVVAIEVVVLVDVLCLQFNFYWLFAYLLCVCGVSIYLFCVLKNVLKATIITKKYAARCQ